MTEHAPDITLILGGVRSGKSRAAIALADEAHNPGHRLFIATGQALDEEMRRRIEIHRRERSERWETLEVPLDLAKAIDTRFSNEPRGPRTVVIDCLTLWVSNVLLTLDEADDAEQDLGDRTKNLLEVIATHASSNGEGGGPRRWIIVSNEVGLGVVPATALGRRYRDAMGRTNQLVAAAARRVVLMVAGLSVELKAAPTI